MRGNGPRFAAGKFTCPCWFVDLLVQGSVCMCLSVCLLEVGQSRGQSVWLATVSAPPAGLERKRYLAHREELSFLTRAGCAGGEMSFLFFLSPVPFSSCFPSFLSVASFSSSNFTCPSQAPSASDSPCPPPLPCPHGTPFHGRPSLCTAVI